MEEDGRKPGRRSASASAGFTLVELLVVVSIIVGLAAVVSPRVSQFANKGSQGEQTAELDYVQFAMDTMIADKGLAPPNIVTANDLGTSDVARKNWVSTPTEGPLKPYLRDSTTKYFYCWDSTGKITEQFDTGASCTV